MHDQSHSPEAEKTPANQKRRLRIFKAIAILIGIGVGLIAAEFGLRLIEKMELGDRAPVIVSDPALGLRILPNTSGHDANGFRNATLPARADIVVLGDSQTWGVNVHAHDAWPQQLARMSGKPVYNMALNGYGPVQYWILTDKALELSPQTIVVGLYLGNDLYDAYAMAYTKDNYAELRATQYPAELRQDTIAERAKSHWDEEKNFHNNYGRSSPRGWSIWLRGHTAIGRLLNRKGWWPGASDIDHEIDVAWARTYPEHGAVCDDPVIRTVFTPAYRLTGLNLSDPRVGEGIRITKELLSRVHVKTQGRGVSLVVVMIPTKEVVYAERMREKSLWAGTYARVVEMELSTRKDLLAWCPTAGIRCIDPLPSLQRALAERRQVYPSSTESHPNAAGYAVVAGFVSETLAPR